MQFHEILAECDAILTEKGMDGDYMIRESETNVCIDMGLFLGTCRAGSSKSKLAKISEFGIQKMCY